MSETNQTSTEEENEIDIKHFLTVKNFYMSYFQNIASSQAVRLIGFTAGVFTLMGVIKLSPDEHLGEFFSDVYTFHIIRSIVSISPEIISAFNFGIFFGAIFILMFFIFRAIFRYMAFSDLSDTLIYLTRNDVKVKNRKRESGDASKKGSFSSCSNSRRFRNAS